VTITYLAVDAPPWTDRGAFWIALAGAAIAVASLIVTIVYGRRSAGAAEASAAEAKNSADSAAQVARAELERDHRANQPTDPAAKFHLEESTTTPGRVNLFFTFTLRRNYRFDGRTAFGPNGGHGSFNADPSHVLEAGKPVRVYVDDLSATKSEPQVKMLELEFWPPRSNDPGEEWTCPCHRGVNPDGDPHWVWNVPVVVPSSAADQNLFLWVTRRKTSQT
jgi:hypothetical protein